MKIRLTLMMLGVAIACWIPAAYAADKHAHDHAGGPRGGKLLEKSMPHAEFFVEKDRTVSIAFYDEKRKPVAATVQTVSVIAEAKTGRVRLEFAKKKGKLVSKKKLPDGDGYRVVVLLKSKPDEKSKNYRFELHDEVCKECKRAEYACICEEDEHEHGKEDEHEH